MLVIDDDKLKLAKMQERLLRATDSNRENNLNNYRKTVSEIDSEVFGSLLEVVKTIGEHNHSLEEELEFLRGIKESYEQLRELQLGFISVCELYGSDDLGLSDLSQLNIEYIENRIVVIEGYLLNIRNIETNKEKIQELDKLLVEETKRHDYLSSKLEQLELSLRESFISAEGRELVNGDLSYTSVIDEYKRLDIDFAYVLENIELLRKMLVDIDRETKEVEEKYRTAELCYNNFPNAESKQILDEIRVDFFRVRYKFSMLKIIELLTINSVDYDKFREKREKLLDLIKYRLSCLDSLGIKFSIDPFSRTRVREQLDALKSLNNNSKIINGIRKDISQLTTRTEEMITQNVEYKKQLTDTKELLISRVSINDIDVSSVELLSNVNVVLDEDQSDEIEENQVVAVRDVYDSLNMTIISQKTLGVIKRVNQMMNDKSPVVSEKIEEPISVSEIVDEPTEISPELVIVPSSIQVSSEIYVDDRDGINDDIFVDFTPEEALESQDDVALVESSNKKNNEDIFETVVPFVEPVIFTDKADGFLEQKNETSEDELDFFELPVDNEHSIQEESVEEMPDAFWVTDNDLEKEVPTYGDESSISFDDQINILLAESEDVKTRKLEVDRNIGKAA